MAKTKKESSLYDSNGRWVEERGRIKGAIRRTFRLSPQMKEVLNKARVELPPDLKKDGTPGKKPRVRYRCAICQELFSQKQVQVDHIEPVTKLHKSDEEMSWDETVRGVFCDVSNLQVLCSTPLKQNNGKSSCHRIKTNEENFIRNKWREHFDKTHKYEENFRYSHYWQNQRSLEYSEYGEEKEKEWKKEYKKHLQEKENKRILKLERKEQRALKRKQIESKTGKDDNDCFNGLCEI
jgi:hypothetical protein